jgi:hypothetical protein
MAKRFANYTFPAIPGRWSEEDRHFAMGLRYLFDRLFGGMLSRDDVRSIVDTKLPEIYPVGIVVLTGEEEPPFSFGEWTAVTTGITGVYGWKRTE